MIASLWSSLSGWTVSDLTIAFRSRCLGYDVFRKKRCKYLSGSQIERQEERETLRREDTKPICKL